MLVFNCYDIWDKVFKNGPSKICGRQPLKSLKCFKGYLPQILLGLFLNTLSHFMLCAFYQDSNVIQIFERYFYKTLPDQ